MLLDNVVDYHFSALFVQKIFRGWKCRKDFPEIRLKIIKLQLQHKGVGLRGLQTETDSFGLTDTENVCKVHLEQDTDVPRNVSIKREPHGIESNQKLIDIYAYPSRSLSLNLHAENLVELNLSCCNYAQLWTGKQALVSLNFLDLNNSKVTQMPDVSEAYKLSSLILEGCINLTHMCSIKSLANLKYLNLKGCTSLKRLPSLLGLKSLCTLNLSDCSNLTRLPLSIGSLFGLCVLNIRNCRRLQNLPISTSMVNSLQVLNISGCLELLKDFNGTEMEMVPPPLIPHSSLSLLILSDNNNNNNRCSLEEGMPSSSTKVPDNSFSVTASEPTSNGAVGIQVFTQAESLSLNQLSDQHRRSSQSSNESATDPDSGLLQQRKELDEYMNMSVEALYEADALQDVARIAEALAHQSSSIPEKTNLEDIICLLDELDDTYRETTLSVKTARAHKTSLQGNLSFLDMRLVQEAEEFITLEFKLDTLIEEEAELEAEIQRLMAQKEELLGRKDIVASF